MQARNPPSYGNCSTLALCCALAWVAGSGCAAIKATQQPHKKDLGVLSQGTPRTHVIAELGAPTWSEERDGVVTDVFAFKQGYAKGVKAGRALIHGAADVATFGLWEVVGIPAETLADGSDVKVSIAYDRQQRVESIDVIQGEKVIHPRGLFGRKRRRADPAFDPPDEHPALPPVGASASELQASTAGFEEDL